MNFRNIIWGWQRKQLCTCDVCLPAPQSLHCTENLLTWTFKVFLLLVCNFVFHELWYGYGFLNHCSWLINLQSLKFFKLPMDIEILVLWSWKLAWVKFFNFYFHGSVLVVHWPLSIFYSCSFALIWCQLGVSLQFATFEFEIFGNFLF